MALCALQASATLTTAQERVEQLAAVVGTLVTAPPALRGAMDALRGALSQHSANEEAVPDRASCLHPLRGQLGQQLITQ
jgi:hypothetical protein